MKTQQKGGKIEPGGRGKAGEGREAGKKSKGAEGRGHAALRLSLVVFIAFIYNIYSNFYNNFNLITSKFDLVLIHIKLGL